MKPQKKPTLGDLLRKGVPFPIWGDADGNIILSAKYYLSGKKIKQIAPLISELTNHRPQRPTKKPGPKPKKKSPKDLHLDEKIRRRFLELLLGKLIGVQIWKEKKGDWHNITHDVLPDNSKKMDKGRANRILSQKFDVSLSRIRKATDPT